MNSQTLLWLTTFIMTGGGLLILVTGKRRTPAEELHTVLHGIVPLIAACSYFAMANGQGAIMLGANAANAGTGRIFYFARYIDWTFTTPLLLVTLAMTAMHAGTKRTGAIAGMVLADLMMILTALFFGASETGWIKWTWFIISCAAFLGVYYVILLGANAANAGTGRIFYFARYIDWTFTTPLLLVTLAMTAMHAGTKRTGAIAGMVLADLMMILTALFFGASETGWIKWTWFIISCAAFLGVYYVIWVSLMQANALERDDIQTAYRRNAMILSVLWLIYPLVLAVAPDGLNYIGDTASILAIAVLDVISKVVYGLMTVASDAKATERDLAEAGRPQKLRAAA